MQKRQSSQRWLQEHESDFYVKEARRLGYRSRAVFKLLEIQKKDQLIKPGMCVVELGAAPGGWSAVGVEWLKGKGQWIALDILPMDPIPGVNFIQGDFREQSVFDELSTQVEGQAVDIVISDLAPNISGNASVDQPRMVYLAELALDFASQTLGPGGALLLKIFQGEGYPAFLAAMRKQFKRLVIRKPKASRARSPEVYVLGINYQKT